MAHSNSGALLNISSGSVCFCSLELTMSVTDSSTSRQPNLLKRHPRGLSGSSLEAASQPTGTDHASTERSSMGKDHSSNTLASSPLPTPIQPPCFLPSDLFFSSLALHYTPLHSLISPFLAYFTSLYIISFCIRKDKEKGIIQRTPAGKAPLEQAGKHGLFQCTPH